MTEPHDRKGPPPEDFNARLKSALEKSKPPPDAGSRGSAMGIAFRLSTDFVSAVVVGGFIGWILDYALGSGPWLLLTFFFLGVAAGFANVVRTARQLNADVLSGASDTQSDESGTSRTDRDAPDGKDRD